MSEACYSLFWLLNANFSMSVHTWLHKFNVCLYSSLLNISLYATNDQDAVISSKFINTSFNIMG